MLKCFGTDNNDIDNNQEKKKVSQPDHHSVSISSNELLNSGAEFKYDMVIT